MTTTKYVRHTVGPTTPFPREGLMFYERRCTRCGTLLDMGRINPTLLFEEGQDVIREEHDEDGMLTVKYTYQYVWKSRSPYERQPQDCLPIISVVMTP